MSKWYFLFNIIIIYVIIIIITDYYIEKCILLYNRNILYFCHCFFKYFFFILTGCWEDLWVSAVINDKTTD